MMTTGKKNIEQVEILSITCDKCGTKYTPKDIIEWQELHCINFTGGYGSVFGDTSEVKADFCQRCLKELIKPYCRVDGLSIADI